MYTNKNSLSGNGQSFNLNHLFFTFGKDKYLWGVCLKVSV